MCNENVSGSVNCSKIRGVREWNCVWEGTDNGNLVVNTEWGQKEKRTCETSLKGSVTGKTYEAAFYWASQSSIKNAVDLFDIKKKKKSYWTNKQKVSNAQRNTDEKPLLL